MYDPNNPEDDMNERYEEMERMREHVFKESDRNEDGLIRLGNFVFITGVNPNYYESYN